LKLSDQRGLMFFQIRNTDGSIEAVSGGTLVQPDGTTQRLNMSDVNIEVLETWRSPTSDATYPVRWHIAVPSHDIQLEALARVYDQEMDVSVVYWEGAVSVTGQVGDVPVTGAGYIELTGYSSSLNGRF
jgi:predicted secreted hydrolase